MRISTAKAGKTYVLILTLLIAVTTAFSQNDTAFSLDTSPLPAPTGFVNDYAGVLSNGSKQSIDAKLTDLKKRTGVEIGVAIVTTTGDRPIFDYSLAVARGWKIGSKDDDNPSALLFVAINDRKYFTQISRDLEDELPDGVAGSLQRQFLVPEFKKQNYAKGISDTLDAYIRTIDEKRSGTTTAAPVQTPERSSGTDNRSAFGFLCCIGIIVLILLIIWFNRNNGGGSGGRRGHVDSGFGSALPWIIGSMIANSGNSSSSGSSWGGSSGGWSGGGGFGGFGGGGDFGGGGAGGSW